MSANSTIRMNESFSDDLPDEKFASNVPSVRIVDGCLVDSACCSHGEHYKVKTVDF